VGTFSRRALRHSVGLGIDGADPAGFHDWKAAREFKVYSACIAQLKADPEVALREHWPDTRTTMQSRAFFDAVWAPYVQFSPSQVERSMPTSQRSGRSCSNRRRARPNLFRRIFRWPSTGQEQVTLDAGNIVHHPHTPLSLVQRVVFYRKQLPFEPPYQAGLALQIRKPDVPADPRETLKTCAGEARGKFSS